MLVLGSVFQHITIFSISLSRKIHVNACLNIRNTETCINYYNESWNLCKAHKVFYHLRSTQNYAELITVINASTIGNTEPWKIKKKKKLQNLKALKIVFLLKEYITQGPKMRPSSFHCYASFQFELLNSTCA